MSRVRTCGVSDTNQLQHLNANSRHLNMARELDSGQTLYVRVKYFVVYRNTAENLSISLLQAQHQQLNMVYNGLNTESLSQVPKTGRYAFANVIGNPRIVFLPSNALSLSETDIVRLAYTGPPFAGLNSTYSYLVSQGFPVQPGYLHLYLVPLNEILGESDVAGNRAAIEITSVGGFYHRGALENFNLGMTVCHEIGHTMGLTHTWNTTQAAMIMPDIPIQKNPNYTFEFTTNGGARNCNRMKDCAMFSTGQSGELQSWLCSGLPCNACSDTNVLFEMGCGIMDYATDMNMVMFSNAQCIAMRSCLLSNSNDVALAQSDGGLLTVASAADAFSSTLPSPSQNNPQAAWKKYLVYFITFGVLLGLLAIGLTSTFVYLKLKHKTRQ